MFLLTAIENQAYEYYCEAQALSTRAHWYKEGLSSDDYGTLAEQLEDAAVNILVKREGMSEQDALYFLQDIWDNAGASAEAEWSELQKRTISYYCANTIWKTIISWISSAMNKLAFGFMSSFSPDMSTYLTMFGYNDGADAFAAVSWASTTSNTVLNAFSVFAVMGYILAIVILVISLFKVSLANVTDTKDSASHLLIRFFVSFLLITYANSIIYIFLTIAQKIWDKILAINDLTQSGIKTSVDTSGAEAAVTKIGVGEGAINIGDMNLILASIMLIFMSFLLLHLVVEIVEKYLVVGFLYISFPVFAATFVSRETEGILSSYFRMLVSELLLLVMNAWCVTMFCNLLNNIGTTSFTPFGQCIVAIAFLKFSTKLDTYVQSLGLNAAITGSGLVDQILASAGSIIAMPGRVANSARTAINHVNRPLTEGMSAALNNGDYSRAKEYADSMMTESAKARANAAIRNHMRGKDVDAQDVRATGVDHTILSGNGHGFSDVTAGSAIRGAGGRSIANELARQYGVDPSKVQLSDGAVYDNRDQSWHMTANIDGQELAFKVTSDDVMAAQGSKDKSFASFRDSKGAGYKVSVDDVARQSKTTQDDAKTGVKFQNGDIKNPIQAEAATGIHNKYGVHLNADGSITTLDKDGNLTNERYVPDGYGGYISIYTDETMSRAAGFGADTYQGKRMEEFLDKNDNILDKDAAKAFTGIDNEYGIHANRDENGEIVSYERLSQSFDQADYKAFDDNQEDYGKFFTKEEAIAMGADFSHMDTTGYDMSKYEAGIYVHDDGFYSYALRLRDDVKEQEKNYEELDPDDNFDPSLFDEDFSIRRVHQSTQAGIEGDENGSQQMSDGDKKRDYLAENGYSVPALEYPLEELEDETGTLNKIYDQTEPIDIPVPEGYEDPAVKDQNVYGGTEESSPDSHRVGVAPDAPIDEDKPAKRYADTDLDGVAAESNRHAFGFSDVYNATRSGEDTIHFLRNDGSGEEGDVKVYQNGSYSPINGDFVGETMVNDTSRRSGKVYGNPQRVMRNDDGSCVRVEEGGDVFQASRAQFTNIRRSKVSGYNATMTVRGIYKNDSSDRNAATINVRLGDYDTRQGNEVIIGKFKDEETGETQAIFATRREMGRFVKQSAGKDFENSNLGRAAMQMSEKRIRQYSEEPGSSKAGNTFSVNLAGNQISVMNENYSSSKNHSYDYGTSNSGATNSSGSSKTFSSSTGEKSRGRRVVSTRYDDHGRKLYDYRDQRDFSLDSDMKKAREGFEKLYREKYGAPGDTISATPIRRRHSNTTDYRINVTTKDGDQYTKIFRNAANIEGSMDIKKSNATLKNEHGDNWIDVTDLK